MPLVGGGGAGNTAGGNPSGTGGSVNYIGEHAYANSGLLTINNNETALLDFTTGPQYIVAKIQFNYAVSGSANDDYAYRVKFDSQIIQEYVVTGATSGRDPTDNPLFCIIPPYTRIECTAQNVTDTSSNVQVVVLTGRVYNA